MSEVKMPSKFDLMWPTVKALKDLGGSGTVSEIVEQIIRNECFKDEVLSILHSEGRMTKVAYNAAWARTCLRTYGAVESRKRGLYTVGGVGIAFRSDYGWVGDGHSADNSFFYGDGGGLFFHYFSTGSQGYSMLWRIRPK